MRIASIVINHAGDRLETVLYGELVHGKTLGQIAEIVTEVDPDWTSLVVTLLPDGNKATTGPTRPQPITHCLGCGKRIQECTCGDPVAQK
jgi:hypothetical protein